MIHTNLKQQPAQQLASSIIAASKTASSQTTGASGSITIRNADGTKNIFGSANGTDATGTGISQSTYIGDKTAPGKPIGVTAASSAGVIVAFWSGSLEGGVPADFHHVNIYAVPVSGSSLYVLGTLVSEGSVTSASLTAGQQYRVYANAEDSACDEAGNAVHNVSVKSDDAMVTVTSAADPAAIDAAQKAAEDAASAAAAAQSKADDAYDIASTTDNAFWSDADGAHVSSTGAHDLSGQNMLLTSTQMAIRKALAAVATFSESLIELGKNSASSVIKFCAGNGQIGSDTGSNQLYLSGANGAYLARQTDIDNGNDFGIGLVDDNGKAKAILRAEEFEVAGQVLTWAQMAHALECPFPVGFVGMFSDAHKPTDLYPGTSWTKEDITFVSAVGNLMALDVQNGTAANGTLVQIYSENGAAAQRWWWHLQTEGESGAFYIRTA